MKKSKLDNLLYLSNQYSLERLMDYTDEYLLDFVNHKIYTLYFQSPQSTVGSPLKSILDSPLDSPLNAYLFAQDILQIKNLQTKETQNIMFIEMSNTEEFRRCGITDRLLENLMNENTIESNLKKISL